MLRNLHTWIWQYFLDCIWQKSRREKCWSPTYVLFTICDHFEPYWNHANHDLANKRVAVWRKHYPLIALKHVDSFGRHPKHCFFYPVEEYNPQLVDSIAEICHQGLGEVEVHIHHDKDTSDNLRTTLVEYSNLLHSRHRLLSISLISSKIQYAFIHGNWALDNSRPDGRWCGVNNEITVLQETNCYADFSMPSAPSNTQTSTINRIYYAVDDPEKPKSHDKGTPAVAGLKGQPGLLCVQGPLCLNFASRKLGLLPRIENGSLSADLPATQERISLWYDCHIHVLGRPDIVFMKLYTHGAQDKTLDLLFYQSGLESLFTNVESFCETKSIQLMYVSPREMYNIIKGIECNSMGNPVDLLNLELVTI